MKATKKDLKKLEGYIAGLRDLIGAKKFSYSDNDIKNMVETLSKTESIISSIAFNID
ncbi:MAG: hypothetical protein PF487_13175 [Bacteroidales bacterium]|jgi:hypothetical protein|nr:hypothetical protein [Bacteroidales bacterium]